MRWLTFLLSVVGLVTFAGGQIVFEKETIESRAALMDERAEAVFEFINIGDHPVTITKVSSSCGCTVPQLKKKLYQPGERGEIRAVFTFGERTKTQRKNITVEVEGAVRKTHLLKMVTIIPEWIKVEPSMLRWRAGEKLDPQEFKLALADPEAIGISLAKKPEFFQVELIDRGSGDIICQVTPNAARGPVTEALTFRAEVSSSDGKVRSKVLNVFCLIR